jgi:hypothetical protein
VALTSRAAGNHLSLIVCVCCYSCDADDFELRSLLVEFRMIKAGKGATKKKPRDDRSCAHEGAEIIS